MKALIRIFGIIVTLLLFIYANAVPNKKIEDSLSLLKANYPLVYKNLVREFKNIEHLKYKVEMDVLYLAFDDNNNKTSAVFNVNGKRKYSVTDAVGCLSNNIKATIKTAYPGYSIYAGKEIKTSDKTIHQVIIENKLEYRVINFLDEEMEEEKKIKKTL
jgi:hypothetical protein